MVVTAGCNLEWPSTSSDGPQGKQGTGVLRVETERINVT